MDPTVRFFRSGELILVLLYYDRLDTQMPSFVSDTDKRKYPRRSRLARRSNGTICSPMHVRSPHIVRGTTLVVTVELQVVVNPCLIKH